MLGKFQDYLPICVYIQCRGRMFKNRPHKNCCNVAENVYHTANGGLGNTIVSDAKGESLKIVLRPFRQKNAHRGWTCLLQK